MFFFKRLLLLQHDCHVHHVCIFHAMLFPLSFSISLSPLFVLALHLSVSELLLLRRCALIAAAVPTVSTSSNGTFSPFLRVLVVLVVVQRVSRLVLVMLEVLVVVLVMLVVRMVVLVVVLVVLVVLVVRMVVVLLQRDAFEMRVGVRQVVVVMRVGSCCLTVDDWCSNKIGCKLFQGVAVVSSRRSTSISRHEDLLLAPCAAPPLLSGRRRAVACTVYG